MLGFAGALLTPNRGSPSDAGFRGTYLLLRERLHGVRFPVLSKSQRQACHVEFGRAGVGLLWGQGPKPFFWKGGNCRVCVLRALGWTRCAHSPKSGKKLYWGGINSAHCGWMTGMTVTFAAAAALPEPQAA